ncbi:MAG TPA: transporter [Candidatus Elarobacter sp.]
MTIVRALGAFAVCCALACTASPAMAGPPYQTDDPDPTAYRHYEIYILGTYGNEPGRGVSGSLPSAEINYGLMPNVQFSVTLPFVATQDAHAPIRLGYGDTEVALKIRFVQEHPGCPQVAFYPGVVFPTGNAAAGLGTGLPKTFLPLWAQKTNGSWTFFGGGGFWHNPGAGNRDYTFTGAAATHQVRDGLAIGGELYRQTADTVGGVASTSVAFGVTSQRGEHHALLASVGRTLTGANAFNVYAAYELYLGPRETAP